MSLEISNVHVFLEERRGNYAKHLRAKGIDMPSAALVRGSVYSLGIGETLALDADDDNIPRPEVDEANMTATFIISTPRKDRYGDTVVPRGCQPHIENYTRNPRVFFSHHSTSIPLGSARDLNGNLLVEISDAAIKSTCKFHGETPESDLIFRLVAQKELQTASIGFLPVKGALIRDDDEEDRPRKDDEGNKILYFDGWFPLKFLEWDLLEWSIVPVPANADCISMHLSRGKVGGQDITPTLRKALEPYALPRKVWSPGADIIVPADSVELKDGIIIENKEDSINEARELHKENKEETLLPNEILLIKRGLKEMPQENPVEALLKQHIEECNKQHVEIHRKLDELLLKCCTPPPPPVLVPQQETTNGWDNVLNVLSSLEESQRGLEERLFSLTGKRAK